MSFKEIIGQNLAIGVLRNSLKEKHLGLSYLFYGPSGVGKSFTARQFAKALNCENSLIDDCCDNCSSCRRADSLRYPDLHWLELAGGSESIKIEEIRSLQNDIHLRPFEGRVKVFIINNCQEITPEAASCLLKVLEEPPYSSVIILISPSLRSLMPTVISRCQKIKFSNLRRQEAEEILRRVYKIDSQASHFLAYYSEGRIGEALALCRSNLLAEKNIILDRLRQDYNYTEAEGLFEDKARARRALTILITWFRDLMCSKIGCDNEHFINQDRAIEIRREALRYSYSELASIFNLLTKSFEYLDKNINTKLLSENLRIKIWKN